MVTTFFPPHNFGGDGIHVYRLSNELARRGHEVTVVYPSDAYRLFARTHPGRATTRSSTGVTVAPVTSAGGRLGPAVELPHGPSRAASVGALHGGRSGAGIDVVHFHNVSLAGGAGVLRYGERRQALHDERALARLPDARAVEAEPRAVRGAAVHPVPARLPPAAAALALRRSARPRATSEIDLFLSPSRFTIDAHRARGFRHPMRHLPTSCRRAEAPRARGGGGARASVLPLRRAPRGAQGRRPLLEAFRTYDAVDLVIVGDGDRADSGSSGARPTSRTCASSAGSTRPRLRRSTPARSRWSSRPSATRCSASSCSRRSRRGRPRSSATSAPCRS